MNKKEIIEEKIKTLVKEYFSLNNNDFVEGKSKISLSVPSYDWEESFEAIKSIISTWVTMGKKVHEFERLFSKYINVNFGVMVNSGSSANLLALSVLANPLVEGGIKRGDEIITPSITWSTTVAPIINIGAIPVFVDVDPQTFLIETRKIEKAITKKTKAIMPVHILGAPCNMKHIKEIAEKHDLFIIEDCCEAHGAEYQGKKVGGFGDLSTFSFFFSHHISTIEGGIVNTNNEEFFEIAKSLRAHGWIRELKDRNNISLKYPKIDERFLFTNIGYNMRPTEIQGAFGIHQIKKLDNFIEIRRNNANYWSKTLNDYSEYISLTHENKNDKHVWFGYPITITKKAPFTRRELMDFLESKNIETRPIMAGNIIEQPFMKHYKYKKIGNMDEAKFIMRNSFFFGNHHEIGNDEREYITKCFDEFIKSRAN